MQITPIIPTTDTLIVEALGLAKKVGFWLWEQFIGMVCLTTYNTVVIVPFKNLGATKEYSQTPIVKSGFVWFSGRIGLGYISVAAKDTYIKAASFYEENGQTFVHHGSTWSPSDREIGVTLPRWKIAAYHAETRRLFDAWAPQTRINVNTLELNKTLIDLVKQVAQWRDSRAWFEERNIPHTLGIVLYGPPGSGKTTLVKTIAAVLGREVWSANLLDKNLFDWGGAPPYKNGYSHVWLIEDIDCVFNKRQRVCDGPACDFDKLLNGLSGVKSPPGRVVIITTNHPETLDPALAHIPTDGSPPVPRPGRIDHIVYVGPLDKEACERVVARVFPDRPDLWHDLVVAGEGETIALFQARCVTLALELKAKENT